jgi:hypothetical protein
LSTDGDSYKPYIFSKYILLPLLHEYIYESSRVKKKIAAAFQNLFNLFTPKFYDVNFVLRQPAHIITEHAKTNRNLEVYIVFKRDLKSFALLCCAGCQL